MQQCGNSIQTEIASGLKPLVPQGGIIASGAKQSAFPPYGARLFPRIGTAGPQRLTKEANFVPISAKAPNQSQPEKNEDLTNF
jgi:hypothetical protein